MEYPPVACLRKSSFCSFSNSLGFLPRGSRVPRATAIPSRVHPEQVGLELGEGG